MKEKVKALWCGKSAAEKGALAALCVMFGTTFLFAVLMVANTIGCPDNHCMQATAESFSALRTTGMYVVSLSLMACVALLLRVRRPVAYTSSTWSK